MSTKVEKRILVNVPVSTAYNQWTQFEDFPHFMGGVKSVKQLSDDRLEWVAEIAGVRRQWQAKILEQVPDRKIAWAATEGATNAGAIEFEDVGGGQTSLRLTLEYEPEGLVEKIGDKLHLVENRAEADLNRFKAFIEDERYASGAWRGTIGEGATAGTPGVEDAAASQGDSGKAGVSGKVVAGAAGVAAAAAAATAAMGSKDKESDAPWPSDPEPSKSRPASFEDMGTVRAPSGEASSTADAEPEVPDDVIARPFDQTNDLVDTSGDSDETAASDTRSAAERERSRNDEAGVIPPGAAIPPGAIPPAGGSAGPR
ncbi:SRPBCC family protein [Arthrobacter sp. ISL-30]|uniref:SRPBCC family protein n=1 Tax=Arthrobacter sp. ISL-30 TaxID=2819109 RepID=UPI001BE9342E|nr:SRPBCC family protein [Arthrobacter sp. ISL-30]MBT2514988.1 SRPBCC family protein [Arthrobacter sp. ISL-30]